MLKAFNFPILVHIFFLPPSTKSAFLEFREQRLRLLVVAVVGREQVGCASGSGGGTVDDKVGEDDEIDARESSPQPGRRVRGGKVTGRRET